MDAGICFEALTNYSAADHREATMAFIKKKREPKFTGE
jgi:hypothetical protein